MGFLDEGQLRTELLATEKITGVKILTTGLSLTKFTFAEITNPLFT